MANFNGIGKTAAIYYFSCVAFVVVFWVLALDVPPAAIVAALALIPIAGMVVGVLIKLSFSHDDDAEEHKSENESH